MRDYYRILDIRPDATREEIKDAWNFSVKAFHPDKFAGSSQRQQAAAQERTKAINEAYEVLSDPVKRANYDWQCARERSTHSAAPPPPPPPPGPSPPPPTSQRPAQTASGHERKQPKAPRTPIFNFQRIIGLLKSCARSLEKGIANLIRKLRASVNATATFFASLMARMSKATSELFRWFYSKQKLLAGAVILLLAGVGLGMSLSPGPRPLLAKLRRLFPNALTQATSTPSPPSLTDQLLREGVESRDRGDTTHAIYFLQEARQIEPDNAIVLAELAKTYELMRLYDYAEEVRHELQQDQTIKRWVDEAAKRGEEWGKNTPYFQARQALARRDYASAASLLQEGADQGDAASQETLGRLYASGKGVPQNYSKAVEFYQKAADQGYPVAQLSLSLLYEHGKGVPRDYRKAAELLQNAADQNYAVAQVDLGWFYQQGRGVPQDYRKAVELFQQAADQDYAVGQAYLASAYAYGKGVPRDYQKARDLFRKALKVPYPSVLNEFAWFLATCPDASQRNGRQAVEHATKACDLTQWKAANIIDTLAAAYAEVGDFATAIKYQKQAMDIPDSDYPDRQQMERSIELYRHAQPYREQ